jgi:hypothetical protein
MTRQRTLLAAALLLAGARTLASSPLAPLAMPTPAASPAPARPDERTSVLRALVVGEGETIEEATCFACDIVVRGRVLGDTVAIFGSIDVAGAAGRGVADDVVALGGAVHVGQQARVLASIVSLGGPVRIDPGGAASSDVNSLPWVAFPGQRQLFPESVASLVALVLVGVLAGAALVRQKGIATRDAALARRPVARALIGLVLLAALIGAMAVAGDRRLGRLEGVAQAALGLALSVALVVGSAGVASLLGRGVARLAGRRLAAGWRSAAVGAVALAVLSLVPLVGAAVDLAALVLACGAAVARRATLAAPPDEAPR